MIAVTNAVPQIARGLLAWIEHATNPQSEMLERVPMYRCRADGVAKP